MITPMYKRNLTKIVKRSGALIGILTLLMVAGQVFAWSAPSQATPGGNALGPVSEGSRDDSKDGGLIINTGNAEYGLLVSKGKVGFGTLVPAGILEVKATDGATSLFIVKDNGNIGVNVADPQSRLSVSGGIQIGADSDVCTTAKTGTVRWQSPVLQLCNGSSWTAF